MEVGLTGRRYGEAIQQDVLIRTIEAPGPRWVSELVATNGLIETRLVEVAHEESLADEAVRRVYRFTIGTQTPATPNAVVTDVLTIETNPPSSMRRIPQISVTAELTPAVRAVPQEVWFRLGDNATFPINRSVLFVTMDNALWNISIPEDLPPWLELFLEPAPGDSALGVKRVRVSVNEQVREVVSDKATQQRELIHIPCTHRECDSVELTIVVSR